jgi:hypothetical protein
MTNRLDTIVTRERKSFVRDLLFAVAVVAATALSISSVSAATNASVTHVAQR